MNVILYEWHHIQIPGEFKGVKKTSTAISMPLSHFLEIIADLKEYTGAGVIAQQLGHLHRVWLTQVLIPGIMSTARKDP